jgi:hypothetical protein
MDQLIAKLTEILTNIDDFLVAHEIFAMLVVWIPVVFLAPLILFALMKWATFVWSLFF